MPLPRSFLYVPANREKFLEKALGLPSDAFIFDLEDSVPVPEKDNARAGVKAYAPKVAGERVWVRTNGLDTGMAEADLIQEDIFFYEGNTHLPMEEHAAVAHYEANGRLTVWTSTQTPHYVHKAMAQVLDMPPSRSICLS